MKRLDEQMLACQILPVANSYCRDQKITSAINSIQQYLGLIRNFKAKQ
jgi:hypothetical protein